MVTKFSHLQVPGPGVCPLLLYGPLIGGKGVMGSPLPPRSEVSCVWKALGAPGGKWVVERDRMEKAAPLSLKGRGLPLPPGSLGTLSASRGNGGLPPPSSSDEGHLEPLLLKHLGIPRLIPQEAE